jgi:hypothetical protein
MMQWWGDYLSTSKENRTEPCRVCRRVNIFCQRHSKIDPFYLVLSFNLRLNPYSFFILQMITLTRY